MLFRSVLFYSGLTNLPSTRETERAGSFVSLETARSAWPRPSCRRRCDPAAVAAAFRRCAPPCVAAAPSAVAAGTRCVLPLRHPPSAAAPHPPSSLRPAVRRRWLLRRPIRRPPLLSQSKALSFCLFLFLFDDYVLTNLLTMPKGQSATARQNWGASEQGKRKKWSKIERRANWGG